MGDLQNFLKVLYSGANTRLTLEQLAIKANRWADLAEKLFLRNEHSKMQQAVVMTCSWTFAVASGLNHSFDVHEELLSRFPGVCPYCGSCPCKGAECKASLSTSRIAKDQLPELSHSARYGDVNAVQDMFGMIYPSNQLEKSIRKIAEETGELLEALMHLAIGGDNGLSRIREEVCDVFAQAFAVANLSAFRLIEVFGRTFANGCPSCREFPCNKCQPGFISVDVRSMTVASPPKS